MKLMTTDNSQNYAKSIKITVMYRILEVLCSTGPKKITNLAMLSGLNHVTCKKYSNLMELLSWVEIAKEKKSTMIIATETGKKIWERLQNLNYFD